MQNKWKASDEAGFVALNGGWVCRRCGCANEGCDVCTRCGWNMSQGCGCQGGVVAAETTATRQTGAGWSCTRCGWIKKRIMQALQHTCARKRGKSPDSEAGAIPATVSSRRLRAFPFRMIPRFRRQKAQSFLRNTAKAISMEATRWSNTYQASCQRLHEPGASGNVKLAFIYFRPCNIYYY